MSDLCTITAAVHVRPWHNKSGWSDPSVPPRLVHFPRDSAASLPDQPPTPIQRVIEAICRDGEIMNK